LHMLRMVRRDPARRHHLALPRGSELLLRRELLPGLSNRCCVHNLLHRIMSRVAGHAELERIHRTATG
jgi:hypothetical protein